MRPSITAMITIALASICVSLILAIIVVLTRKYLTTRDVGFIWLGIAVLAWPRVIDTLRPFLMHRVTGDYGAAFTHISMCCKP